jgi:hypothetical protein
VENLGTIYYYAYDAAGNRTDVVLNYAYDAANRVPG